ncbi:NAD(P)H-dependent flavin oxidoreductase [Streptomyces sp. NPDC001914]|uniref:NAD(P)H-dependent flavin oxidoreductase n=1 Tax=Streptomyces sp. NPDC001914 TaxID=3364623 RepID=UPI0036C438EC
MTLSTAFTALFGVEHPIALAPMGGSAGGELAAAVSRGGGLGLLGAGGGDPDWLARELPIVAGAGRPWGVGFLTWAVGTAVNEQALEYGPAAVMFSFGDPGPYVERVCAAGAAVIVQVTDLDEAGQALELGADVIVAQGTESGGHGSRHGRSTLPFVPVVVDVAEDVPMLAAGGIATLPFVPVVVDVAEDVPVLAAGGIADGRGVAAVLALGAAGAVIGTRFQATAEALVDPSTAKALVDGRGQDTERNRVLDIARNSPWPSKYTARTLGHPYLDLWRGREEELAADPAAARLAYRTDVESGNVPALPVWAGEGVDLVTDLPPAADLVATLATEAWQALGRAGRG